MPWTCLGKKIARETLYFGGMAKPCAENFLFVAGCWVWHEPPRFAKRNLQSAPHEPVAATSVMQAEQASGEPVQLWPGLSPTRVELERPAAGVTQGTLQKRC